MSDTALIAQPERASIDRYLPQSVKDVAWMANEVAKSGIYKNGRVPMTGSEVFVVMMKGGELGLTPMQSMNEISLIKGKPFVSKDVLTARIVRSPRCKHWDPSDCDDKHARIVFGVRGDTHETRELETKIDDIPKRYFAPSASGEASNWTLIPEDMLYAWVVRRIARRWFPEALLDIGDPADAIDESKVIDVAKVERATGVTETLCPKCGKLSMQLHANAKGGAFLSCYICGTTAPPPQAVRDAVRGTPEHLTLAGAAEPALEPGERTGESEPYREILDAPVSAVQSESERDTLEEPLQPASAEGAPIPEPVAPDPVEEAQAIDWMAAWRRDARHVIGAYLETLRALPGKPPERADAIVALKEAGWDVESGDTSQTFVETCSDAALTELLQAFRLEALPRSA